MTQAVDGQCDPRFEPLRDAFRANFAERGERGAAVCVMVSGHLVADLHGGWADQAQGRRWRPDTLVNVFSVGKGLVAACTARLIGQGRLDLEAPVAACWPEFAAAGKEAITVRQLLSHQAGLPAVRRRLPPGAMLDWPAMTTALAGQEPWWPPGAGHGYHVNTFGFLAGEVIRRATGTAVGNLLREENAGPLGADVHIGLPVSEHERVATFIWPSLGGTNRRADPAQLMEHNAYYNPGGPSGAGVINTPVAGRKIRPPTRTAPPAASPASTRLIGTTRPPSSIPPPPWPKPPPAGAWPGPGAYRPSVRSRFPALPARTAHRAGPGDVRPLRRGWFAGLDPGPGSPSAT